jgi:hypothetical protein
MCSASLGLPAELREVQDKFALAKALPLDAKRIKAITNESMASEFRRVATAKALDRKPAVGQSRYLEADNKPIVCIRARLRLGVALTPQRHHIYKHQPTAACSCGGGIGDVAHVLMACNKHNQARSACQSALKNVFYGVPMTLELLLGERPDMSAFPADCRDVRSTLASALPECIKLINLFICDLSFVLSAIGDDTFPVFAFLFLP